MTGDLWIVIPRWDEFQHRDMARSSVPPWIKNMTRLLGDEDYLALTLMQRGLLHGLWLLYASHRRVLSEAEARHSLCRSAGEARRWRDTMVSLSDAGYIELSASRPARHIASEPASLEVETEREVETQDLQDQDHRLPYLNGKADANGRQNGLTTIKDQILQSLEQAKPT